MIDGPLKMVASLIRSILNRVYDALWRPRRAVTHPSYARPPAPSETREPGPQPRPVAQPAIALENTELPNPWGETRLALLVVDPRRLHVYWELGPREMRKLSASPHAAVRFYDVTETPLAGAAGEHGYFEIPVELAAKNWYVDLGEPSAAYRAELGCRTSREKWISLARSNLVTMPRLHPPAIHVEPQRRAGRAVEELGAAAVAGASGHLGGGERKPAQVPAPAEAAAPVAVSTQAAEPTAAKAPRPLPDLNLPRMEPSKSAWSAAWPYAPEAAQPAAVAVGVDTSVTDTGRARASLSHDKKPLATTPAEPVEHALAEDQRDSDRVWPLWVFESLATRQLVGADGIGPRDAYLHIGADPARRGPTSQPPASVAPEGTENVLRSGPLRSPGESGSPGAADIAEMNEQQFVPSGAASSFPSAEPADMTDLNERQFACSGVSSSNAVR